MRTASIHLFVAVLLGMSVLGPEPLAAQGGAYGTVAGTVRVSATDAPLSGALVTLTELTSGATRETTTNASGAFGFTLVLPGSYEIRAEAIGYRPVVARPLAVGGGERRSVALTVAAAQPPVLSVDTVALVGAQSSRWREGGSALGAAELTELAYRFDDLGAVAALSTATDGSLGVQGLPGDMTVVVVDGVPVYRASHPLARSEALGSPLFPASALASVTVLESPGDAAVSGAAGGVVDATTASAEAGRLGLEATWSGDPLWSSGELDIDAPSLTSLEASGSGGVALSPDSRLAVSFGALRHDTPLGPRIGADVEATLVGLDPDLVAELAAPSVERLSRFSGLARFDGRRSEDSHLFLRGAAAYTKRELDGPGPLELARAPALPEESVDYSVAGAWTGQLRETWIYELRLGVSGSERSFEPAPAGRPFAYLAGSGSLLGDVASGAAESSRLDVVLLPSARRSVGSGALRFGLAARLSRHAMDPAPALEMLFSDGAALLAGQGLLRAVETPEASFATRELGAYLAYDFDLGGGLSGSAGVRVDREMLPGSEASFSAAWLQASGLRNDQYPTGFLQVGAAGSFSWDPSLDGATRVLGSAAVQYGDVDPAVLAQAFSQDGAATSVSYAGSGIVWPGESVPGAATASPTLTILGPDTRPPRSIGGTLGIVRRLVAGWSIYAHAAYRRTDFLPRRRNLNRPLIAQAVDAYGRDVFGTLTQDGSLVTATGSDARRFSGFADVWALDPDGWSEYAGFTGGIEYASGSATLYTSYTRSKSTDNWIGAAAGHVDAQLPPWLPGSEEGPGDRSDFDVPDRFVAMASTTLSRLTVSAIYRYRSGLPFTPRYRAGVDANGDGSFRNDVAFVDAALVGALPGSHACLSDRIGAFAARNSCRGPAVHGLDARLRVRLGQVMGRDASLLLDGLDLVESADGVLDDALILVDPAGSLTSSGGTVTIPSLPNPSFGDVVYPASRGRMIRVGLRIG